jgi:hypothetical protein
MTAFLFSLPVNYSWLTRSSPNSQRFIFACWANGDMSRRTEDFSIVFHKAIVCRNAAVNRAAKAKAILSRVHRFSVRSASTEEGQRPDDAMALPGFRATAGWSWPAVNTVRKVSTLAISYPGGCDNNLWQTELWHKMCQPTGGHWT